MEAWQIVLIVISSLVALYLLLLIVNAILLVSFFNLFVRHKKTMRVFLNLKYENVQKLYEALLKNGAKFDEKFSSMICEVNKNDFEDPGSELCKKSSDALTFLKDEMIFIVRSNDALGKNEEVKEARDAVVSLDKQYRNTIASYNADVIGYNYWISPFLTKFVWKLLGLKKKNLING